MDRAVLDAYGWSDVPTDCEFIPDFTEADDEGNEIPKNIRYRWPDEVRDDVLARLLALNAERAAEEAVEGKAAAKKVAKPKKKRAATKKKSVPKVPMLELVSDIEGTDETGEQISLEERIATFDIEIPILPRPNTGPALQYFRNLLPALVAEAGGCLSWDDCKKAVIALADHNEILNRISENRREVAEEWQATYAFGYDVAVFRAALESLAVTHTVIQVVESDGEYELRATDQIPVNRNDWVTLDARLALSAGQAIDLISAERDREIESIISISAFLAAG
jgi:hypothetical protein